MTVPGTVLQVAHVVRDLEATVDRWVRTIGAGPFHVAEFRLEQVHRGRPVLFDATIAVGYLGATNIELVRSNNDEPTIFNEVLAARGEGLHHLWLAADDMDAEMARYEAAGCPVLSLSEVLGVTRSAMIDTSATLGCYVELQTVSPAIAAILADMQATHQSWDGRDPIRPYPGLSKPKEGGTP